MRIFLWILKNIFRYIYDISHEYITCHIYFTYHLNIYDLIYIIYIYLTYISTYIYRKKFRNSYHQELVADLQEEKAGIV